MAYSPTMVQQANADHDLTLLTVTKRTDGPSVGWHIYLVRHSPVVEALTHQPVVMPALSSRTAWLNANVTWWMHPELQNVYMTATGPASWARGRNVEHLPVRAVASETVSHVKVGTQSVSFDVSRLGVPTLVKVSYFPRWQVSGAEGPYRASPNLMIVVPTAHHVELHYGANGAVIAGNLVTDVVVIAGLGVAGLALRKRREQRSRIAPRASQSGL
jgi:hypothetical protein